MDPEARVTQPKWAFRPGSLLLAAALLTFGAAIGYRLYDKDEPAANSGSAMPGSIEGLEARVAAEPKDDDALQSLGEAYFRTGRYEQAADAFRRATLAEPGRAVLWSALGEAEVMASKADPLPASAREAFHRALSLDARDPRARYFVAVEKDLDGDHEGAIAAWLDLLADTPPGAAWEADVRRTIEQVGKINNIPVAARLTAVKQPAPASGKVTALGGIPGPTADDLRGAAAIAPSAQREMAEGMVARLEAKLRANPANIDGWVMLMRSRVTLGEDGKASAALRDAIAANPGEGARLRQEARLLGVK